MSFWEIILIIVIIGFVAAVLGRDLYRRRKGKLDADCTVCMMKNKRTIAAIKKELAKEKKAQSLQTKR